MDDDTRLPFSAGPLSGWLMLLWLAAMALLAAELVRLETLGAL